MKNTTLNPYLYENKTHFGIIGSKEALKNLGELLLLKVKLQHNLNATLTDAINKPILVELDTEILKPNVETKTNPILELEVN